MSRAVLVFAILLSSPDAFAPFDSQHGAFGTVLLAEGQQAVVRLTVADAITRAHDTSHRLAEVRAREEGARAAIKSAETGNLPTFNVGGSYVRTNHVRQFAGSYPAGRFVSLLPRPDGSYFLDFNRARNPFCAYNTVYPCPAPWSGNNLPDAVKAGERYEGGGLEVKLP